LLIFVGLHALAGAGDPDLVLLITALGRATALCFGERLAAHRPNAVHSSPLLRALETAEPIARAAGLQVHADDRLGPGATIEALGAAVTGQGDTVVVVGHQPDCGEIVLALTGTERKFAPGGVAELDL
jgi:phosphohistidine phosphatase